MKNSVRSGAVVLITLQSRHPGNSNPEEAAAINALRIVQKTVFFYISTLSR